MNTKLENLKKFRFYLLNEIKDLTAEQLNKIPTGFNNNIIWNLGHLVSATQAICYRRAGLQIAIDDQYFKPFLTNTKPENFIDNEAIEQIKEMLINNIDTLQTDYNKKLFSNYTKSENIERVYGIGVLNIDDAIDFIQYHDGYHSGYILALKHLVKNNQF